VYAIIAILNGDALTPDQRKMLPIYETIQSLKTLTFLKPAQYMIDALTKKDYY